MYCSNFNRKTKTICLCRSSLNVALFGMTAKEWRDINPELAEKGNIRDYTDLLHLVILNNLQNTNAELIEEKVPQRERG